jgi:hypothetical protein
VALQQALLPYAIQPKPAAGTACCRRADRELWAAALGVTSAPALVFWRGAEQGPLVVQGSLLTNSIDYAAEVDRHIQQPVPPLHAGSAHLLPACQLGMLSAAEGAPPGALCVLLLGRSGQRSLGAGRVALEALHRQLTSGRRQGSAELRQAARLLAEQRLQLASADAAQQQQLCRHLLRWSGSAASSSCMCALWWQRLPAVALGQCSNQQQAVLVAYRQEQQQVGGSSRSRRRQLLVAAFTGSLADQQQLAAWLVAVASSQPTQLLLPAPLPAAQLAEDGAPVLNVLLLRGVLLASQAELAWRQVAAAAGGVLRLISWRQLVVPALLAGGMAALKWLLDLLGGEGGRRGECCCCLGSSVGVPETRLPICSCCSILPPSSLPALLQTLLTLMAVPAP